MSEPGPEYAINGKPLERRCANVTMPVEILHAVYRMQMLRNLDDQTVVRVRLSDWRVIEQQPIDKS